MTQSIRRLQRLLILLCSASAAVSLHAAVVEGRVTDPLGAAVSGATVTLISNGK